MPTQAVAGGLGVIHAILRFLSVIRLKFAHGKVVGAGISVPLPTGYNKMPKDSEVEWSKLVRLGKQLVGKPYNFGEELNLKDPDVLHIKAIDCSELVEWLYAQVGLTVPDGSYNQFKVSKQVDGELRVGDLGFKWDPETHVVHHVGIWLGDFVLEAKGKAWGTVLTGRKEYESSPHFAMWKRLNVITDA